MIIYYIMRNARMKEKIVNCLGRRDGVTEEMIQLYKDEDALKGK